MKNRLLLLGLIGLCACKPEACFDVSNQKVLQNEEVSFTDCSKNGKTYEWDFGDGQQSDLQNPKHAYSKPGFYTAILRVFNNNDEDEYSINIDVGRYVFKTSHHNNKNDIYPSPRYTTCHSQDLFLLNHLNGTGRDIDATGECGNIVRSFYGYNNLPSYIDGIYLRYNYHIRSDSHELMLFSEDTLWTALSHFKLDSALYYSDVTFIGDSVSLTMDLEFERLNTLP